MPYQEDIRNQLNQIQDMGTKATDFATQITAAKQQKKAEDDARRQNELQQKAAQEWQKKQEAVQRKAASDQAKQQRDQAKRMADLTKQNAQLQRGIATGGNNTGAAGPPLTGGAKSILNIAASLRGVPYKWGGNTPAQGLDCSGYVKYVYQKMGINLPRTSSSMAAALPKVDAKHAVAGDLVFFANSAGVHHVGIYAGNGMMWNSPHTGASVRYEKVWRSSGTISFGRPSSGRSSAKNVGKANAYALSLLAKQGGK